VLALFFTGYGSWSCDFFTGAKIGFTGGNYGLWTIQDIDGKCQLWSVLFFSYNLDPALIVARVLSMSAMVLGLALVTTMTQAMQYHVVTWGIGVVFFGIFLASLLSTSIFNVWAVFWLFTYIIYVLIVRALFIHPIHRRISPRGSKAIAACFLLCMLLTALTMVVFSSDYCTCESLSAGQLEGRITGDPCEGQCRMKNSGYVMLLGSIFWLFSAISTQRIGVQPDELHENPTKSPSMYGDVLLRSIRTATRSFASRIRIPREIKRTFNEGDAQDRPHSRTRVQKLCCDYRVKPRRRKEKILYWIFRVALVLFFIIYFFILMVLIGSRVENGNAERAPDTTPNFILDPVCAFNPLDVSAAFETFPTAQDANDANMTIAHCGPCAYCSNMPDIKAYVETRKTIAESAKECGPIALLGKYQDLVECLEKKIKFSRECTFCWADNMKNTGRRCLFTCMNTLFSGFMSHNNVPGAGQQGWLNHCLQCDEKLSGTAFVTCSGVARRRLGIESEIERNPEQQCRTVGEDWVSFFGQGQSK